jgi:hypothetical protein
MKKKIIFSCHLQGQWQKYQDPESDPDPNPDPLVRGTGPRILFQMSPIRNTDLK